jgi:hypothetical protein
MNIRPYSSVSGSSNKHRVMFNELEGIDIGLTQVSILNNFRRANEILGVHDDKIVYIAKLCQHGGTRRRPA